MASERPVLATLRKNLLFGHRPGGTRPKFFPPNWTWVLDAIDKVGQHTYGPSWTGRERTARSLPPLPPNAAPDNKLLFQAGSVVGGRGGNEVRPPEYQV